METRNLKLPSAIFKESIRIIFSVVILVVASLLVSHPGRTIQTEELSQVVTKNKELKVERKIAKVSNLSEQALKRSSSHLLNKSNTKTN